jgi:RNA polymerase primary sigma factor
VAQPRLKLSAKGWRTSSHDKDRIKAIRSDIHALATGTGLEISEFRKIVHKVQKGEREARRAKKEMVEATCASSFRSPKYQPRPAVPRPDPGRQHRPDKAVDKFAYRRGYKFSTRDRWIRQAMRVRSPTRRAPSAFRCT